MFRFHRFVIPSLVAISVFLTFAARAEDTDALKALTEEGMALGQVRFALQGHENPLECDLQLKASEKGQDDLGSFERFYYRISGAPSIRGELQLKRYSDLTVASMDYQGPQLAQKDAIQVTMKLPQYGRGMAIQRMDRYWAGPSFSSEFGLLPESNVLLLWQRRQNQDYRLLIPLAGDGMLGEVGKHRLQFGVTMSSEGPNTPRHIPLFVFAGDNDPYRLADRAYRAAFREGNFYGRLRKDKPFPEIFRNLGWCSWNAYYDKVSEKNLVASAESFLKKRIPTRYMLIDDGWMHTDWKKLAGFKADATKFPGGLEKAVTRLKNLGIKDVGVWHTLHGYWDGVVPEGFKGHNLLEGQDGMYLQNPLQKGESLFHDWYQSLSQAGIGFVKVDGQANTSRFTNGLIPLFKASEGTQRNLQEAGLQHFKFPSGPPMINCMEMTIDNAYNWRHSNIARASDDFNPKDPATAKEHVFQSAYNAYWISNFAYPDYDMFQSYLPDGEYHAIARAISGGPIYTADELGLENAELLKRFCLSDGRLLMVDEPGQVTRDTLLVDTGLEAVPLKIFGKIQRPGVRAGVVAAFNANKTRPQVTGNLKISDVEGLSGEQVAVYQRSTGSVRLLQKDSQMPIRLGEYGADVFSLVPIKNGIAVFGLLDKYLGPAAIVQQNVQRDGISVTLAEAGDFGAWLGTAPRSIRINGKTLGAGEYRYQEGLLRIPARSFPQTGESQVWIQK